ncbi:D-alanine--D-alanine ligase family protein [Marinicella gelatinilytica]|uniref:D-alanine--D-alanine ligase family protein n=1 Tax=Marinicella gelatinilytica TaxID=2996017 RepID=UPI002260F336|nr:D-alanine--D-alanine ligase [Marinicella gelatinilytica]MCX7545158.1 D-alanine--D-alanine ligase [Marinicella gelatinilytica]
MTKRIALLMGGHSAEREVSLSSGHAVAAAIKELGYEVICVNDVNELKALSKHDIDLVFNLLHGADGEDGQLAAWLALEGLTYTGCDYVGACLSWHKHIAKTLVAQQGILTPPFQILTSPEQLIIDAAEGPWIVKPASEGSSVGLTKVNHSDDLADVVKHAFNLTNQVLVEAYVSGTECTVGMVGKDILPVVSIEPAGELYDYEAKYNSSSTRYHCPPSFSKALQRQLQADTQQIFETLQISGWGRVDFIVDEAGRRWFLEVNTTPGMTATSLLPKAAKVHGWDFNRLVAEIIKTGWHHE